MAHVRRKTYFKQLLIGGIREIVERRLFGVVQYLKLAALLELELVALRLIQFVLNVTLERLSL